MNKLMTASISPTVCKIRVVCQNRACAFVVFVGLRVRPRIPGNVLLHILYAAFLLMCVCVCTVGCLRTLARTRDITRKQNQLVCATQTLQWSSPGSLGQSKITILRCRQDTEGSCNLSSRLTWRHKTAAFVWFCISDLLRGFRQGLNVMLCQVNIFRPPSKMSNFFSCGFHPHYRTFYVSFCFRRLLFLWLFLPSCDIILPVPPPLRLLSSPLVLFVRFFSSYKLIASEHRSYAWPFAAQPAW